MLVTRCFHDLLDLRQTRCPLWGTPRSTPSRVRTVTLGVLLHTRERLCRRRYGLVGCPLFGSYRGCHRLAQLMLHMKDIGRVMHPQVVFDIR